MSLCHFIQKHVSLKIRADLIESFITALYLDKGMNHVETFCQICLFPKLSVSPASPSLAMVLCLLQISAKGLKFLDPKTRLQHAVVYTCKREKIPIEFPVYRYKVCVCVCVLIYLFFSRVLSKEGPVNSPIFTGLFQTLQRQLIESVSFQLVCILETKGSPREPAEGKF